MGSVYNRGSKIHYSRSTIHVLISDSSKLVSPMEQYTDAVQYATTLDLYYL